MPLGGRDAVCVPFFFLSMNRDISEELVRLNFRELGTRYCPVLLAFALRLIAFLVLVFGIFVLHSGAILLILLAIYLALFFVLQRLGIDIVRQQTESPIAAAVFGAILLAGFCLVIFPVT